MSETPFYDEEAGRVIVPFSEEACRAQERLYELACAYPVPRDPTMPADVRAELEEIEAVLAREARRRERLGRRIEQRRARGGEWGV